MRIVFLGNDYNRFSIACLTAAIDSGHDVTAGIYSPQSTGLFSTAKTAFERRGIRAVLRGGVTLLTARIGASFRSTLGLRSGVGSLRELAVHRRIPVLDVTHLEDPRTVGELRAIKPDLIVVAGFSRILRREVIQIPSIACINVHPSWLPSYRGPNPIYWVLANNESETGVSVHFLEEKIDAGDIIGQRRVPIQADDDERALFERCSETAALLLSDVLRSFEQGKVQRIPQDPREASYYSHPPRGASKL